MRAETIKPGDQFEVDGETQYTVEAVAVEGNEVRVGVRYVDGGTGGRIFSPGQDVPLVRP